MFLGGFLRFVYFCLCWVFVAVCGLSLVVARGLLVAVASLVVAPWLQSLGSVVAHGLSLL